MGPFGEVMEIFAPGFRHLAEEKDRRRMTMQIPGSGGNPLGVDLDKGTIRIQLPPAPPAAGGSVPAEAAGGPAT